MITSEEYIIEEEIQEKILMHGQTVAHITARTKENDVQNITLGLHQTSLQHKGEDKVFDTMYHFFFFKVPNGGYIFKEHFPRYFIKSTDYLRKP